uniref:Uncharacterized protein n=1 Tax=Calidris pygmaea TaxID=425635 RepID=A0A8C3JLZ7_9CHAR
MSQGASPWSWSTVLGLHIELVEACFLIVQRALQQHLPAPGFYVEELPDAWWCVSTEGVLNLPIGALIQVSGVELDDQGASRGILREAHAIRGLVKSRHVVVRIQHRDEDVGCA